MKTPRTSSTLTAPQTHGRRFLLARRIGRRVFAVTFAVLLASPVPAARGASAARDLPDGLDAADWAGIRQVYEAGRHVVRPVAGGHRAENPGQAWSTHFDGRGFTTRPRGGGWTWGLELLRYGIEGAERSVEGSARVSTDGQELAYDWDPNLREWYVNDARGLEHGYTLQRRPKSEGSGPKQRALTLTMAVRGGLVPRVQECGRDVSFVNESGVTVLSYSGLLVFDADGKTFPARFDRVADGLRLTIDERGARYPLTIDPVAQQGYLKASNTQMHDRFGYAVAVSGDTVVVSAHLEDSSAVGVDGDQSDNNAILSGAVYVFVRSGATWIQQAYLKASNTERYDGFGLDVAVSGDTLVVGAGGEDSAATGVNGDQTDNSSSRAGAVYVFVRDGTSWSQEAFLKASSTGIDEKFGYSVSVSGDTVVVGAYKEDSNATGVNGDDSDNSASSAGAAYVFVRNAGTWSQEAYLKASNTDAGDEFGYSVSVSGDTIVVGAQFEGSNATGVNGDEGNNGSVRSGAAYVFVRNGTNWSQEAYLKASNTGSNDRYGYSVSVSGDTAIVGSYLESSSATGVNGDESDNSASTSGAAYVYVRNGTSWSQEAYLKASNTQSGDHFGCSVSISGDTAVVGAALEDSAASGVDANQGDNSSTGAGAAYVFLRNGSTWSQEAYLKASNTGEYDNFGESVAVSGNVVVVGARLEDSNATGVNGDQSDDSATRSGAAYAFLVGPCTTPAAATSRNPGGTNPTSYTATAPVLGGTFTGTVDLAGTTGHGMAFLLGYRTPLTFRLSGGQLVLVNVADAAGELLALAAQPGPVATFTQGVPDELALCGLELSTQALHFAGVTPFALSNAMDLVVGE